MGIVIKCRKCGKDIDECKCGGEMPTNNIKVKIKKLHKDAVIPKYAKLGDAGMDMTTIDSGTLNVTRETIKYRTGIAIEIPEGYVGLIFPRSSICKQNLTLTNSVGVIDSGYRGEIAFVFNLTKFDDWNNNSYSKGDRIGQIIIMPYPQIEFEEVEELDETERGTGGFGSTNI